MLPIRVDTWQHSPGDPEPLDDEDELLDDEDELLEDDEDELLEDDDELDEDDDELLDEELLEDELDELGGMNPHSIQLLNVASTSDQRISRLPCTRAESW